MFFTNLDFLGLFAIIAGFIIGLGAVTVIDLHGFLARKSPYWTEATIRTHKITKPLIWIGIALIILGLSLLRITESNLIISDLTNLIILGLIINGIYLSFRVSPYLIKLEKQNKQKELLPTSFQNKIFISFIFSFLLWWSLVLLVVYSLVKII